MYVSLFAVLANLPLSYTRHGVSFGELFFFSIRSCLPLSFHPHTSFFSFFYLPIFRPQSECLKVAFNIIFPRSWLAQRLKCVCFFVFHLDLVPAMRVDFHEVTASSCEEGKTIFTSDQRAALEAMFRRKKYPTRNEKVKLASKLGVDFCKVRVSLEQIKNMLTCPF